MQIAHCNYWSEALLGELFGRIILLFPEDLAWPSIITEENVVYATCSPHTYCAKPDGHKNTCSNKMPKLYTASAMMI